MAARIADFLLTLPTRCIGVQPVYLYSFISTQFYQPAQTRQISNSCVEFSFIDGGSWS